MTCFYSFHMFTTLFLKEDSTAHCHLQKNFKFHSVILILSSYSPQKLYDMGPNYETETIDNKFALESIWT